jgi:dipeptidyl aminopeptidase/acylaminoacyl peptidase
MSSTLTPGTDAPSKVAVARWSELADLCLDDLTTFDRDMAALSGVSYGGVVAA